MNFKIASDRRPTNQKELAALCLSSCFPCSDDHVLSDAAVFFSRPVRVRTAVSISGTASANEAKEQTVAT